MDTAGASEHRVERPDAPVGEELVGRRGGARGGVPTDERELELELPLVGLVPRVKRGSVVGEGHLRR
uniref:Uncharacterized protein n=1 Tax=Arundo donax TaxID=35708 RepID=A0A0A9GMH4_ARUDO